LRRFTDASKFFPPVQSYQLYFIRANLSNKVDFCQKFCYSAFLVRRHFLYVVIGALHCTNIVAAALAAVPALSTAAAAAAARKES